MAKRYGRTLISPDGANAYAFDALTRGSDHADKAGRCERPVMVQLTGLQDGRLHRLREIRTNLDLDPFTDWAPGLGFVDPWGHKDTAPKVSVHNVPVHVDVAVPCRRCGPCLKARSWLWTRRARNECAGALRTWFGTLTLAPQEQSSVEMRARYNSRLAGFDFDRADAATQFIARHKIISEDLTKYLKRVRKASGASLRYLLVAEAHKSGLPHYHALVHEKAGAVRERQLSGQWHLGFTQWRLVKDNGAASYVTKYLAKAALARVRASRSYGSLEPYRIEEEGRLSEGRQRRPMF